MAESNFLLRRNITISGTLEELLTWVHFKMALRVVNVTDNYLSSLHIRSCGILYILPSIVPTPIFHTVGTLGMLID